MRLPIYMDHHATTPVHPRVLEVMLPYFSQKFGNAASVTHSFGWEAQEAVERARATIAECLGAEPKEIIFTSGATESDNLAIKGAMSANSARGNHLVVSAIEHNAVLDPARRLESAGTPVTYLSVSSDGLVDPESVRQVITDRTVLVSVMAANNEIGTIQPIRQIGAITRERGVLFHTDASQAIGKIAIDLAEDSIDLLSLSGHKLYGPKGIGVLFVRRHRPRVRLDAIIDGGGHEQRLRSGTLPVPLIVGLAEAVRLATRSGKDAWNDVGKLRDRLLNSIVSRLNDVRVNGSMEHRLPNNLNLCFGGVDAEGILTSIKDVALSSGSACSSADTSPSHVLKAIGLSDIDASGSIRFGLGLETTREEVDFVADRIVEVVESLRRLTPRHPGPRGGTV